MLILIHFVRILRQRQHHRVFNIGNSQPTQLLRFIEVMEQSLVEAIKEFQPMQPGDVMATAADTQALSDWVGFSPSTSVELGISLCKMVQTITTFKDTKFY